jgi:hypothetical protein
MARNRRGIPHPRPTVPSSRWRCRRAGRASASRLSRHGLSLLVIFSLAFTSQQAGGADQREYAIKAAFLFHLAQFIEWPPEAMPPPEEPIRIGVIEPNPFGLLLEDVVQDATVRDHPILVEYVDSAEKALACQILFVPRAAGPVSRDLLDRLSNEPVLLVGEDRAFLWDGGMVSLIRLGDRVVIEVNLPALREANLTASSRLLRLARILNDSPEP